MLTNSTEFLLAANHGQYAIGHFNINNLETAQGIVAAACAANTPVILGVSKSAITYAGLDNLVAFVKTIAEQVSIPVALHLDHGPNVDLALQCIDAGFTSVMIDTSHLPFAENVAATKQVVDYARPRGVSVEAEIGQLSGIEDNINVSQEQAHYTSVEDAVNFVNATAIDSLAIAIGTAHGIYQGQPQIDFERLSQIHAALPNTPLVLHGSSGVSAASLQDAIRRGISKINIDTDLRLAFLNDLRKTLTENQQTADFRGVLGSARSALQAATSEKIAIFNSAKSN